MRLSLFSIFLFTLVSNAPAWSLSLSQKATDELFTPLSKDASTASSTTIKVPTIQYEKIKNNNTKSLNVGLQHTPFTGFITNSTEQSKSVSDLSFSPQLSLILEGPIEFMNFSPLQTSYFGGLSFTSADVAYNLVNDVTENANLQVYTALLGIGFKYQQNSNYYFGADIYQNFQKNIVPSHVQTLQSTTSVNYLTSAFHYNWQTSDRFTLQFAYLHYPTTENKLPIPTSGVRLSIKGAL